VHVEAGVSHHLGGGGGVLAVQVGQHDVLAGADAPRDRLTDRACSDNDNDVAHGQLLARRYLTVGRALVGFRVPGALGLGRRVVDLAEVVWRRRLPWLIAPQRTTATRL
jgi:hypothetical protein